MGLFKSRQEKQRRIEEKQREIEERARISAEVSALEEKIKNLDRFPGSLSEYISLMGEDYEIMNLERPHKYVLVDSYTKNHRETGRIKDLIGKGCTGLIRYVPEDADANSGYGIPVKPVGKK